MICQGCSTKEDVKTYQFDIDLSMINACELCIMCLIDPGMAERLGVPDPWAESRSEHGDIGLGAGSGYTPRSRSQTGTAALGAVRDTRSRRF